MEDTKYAIIDVETTGSVSQAGKIIEIAIIITDGKAIFSEFSSLVNPERSIPYFITQLTGITYEMVRNAPKFSEIARQIVEITQNCVFVAHNVSFDYGFVRHEFRDLGYIYTRPILCTVQLSRKIFVGLTSYKLGKICQQLDINHQSQHRALGDARATTELFQKIFNQGIPSLIQPQRTLKAAQIPPLLNEDTLNNLPEEAGIYYFYDPEGDVIYVGKSTNIKKRVFSHFSDTKKPLDFKQKIADISYELTGSELVALLWEADEIKRLKPLYNRSQRKSYFNYGIFSFEDSRGYNNLYIEKLNHPKKPLISFSNKQEAKNYLAEKVKEHQLCQKLTGLYHTSGPCFQYQVHQCLGACIQKEPPKSYNLRLANAIQSLIFETPNFYLVDIGRNIEERAIVLVQNGKYIGFGFIDIQLQGQNIDIWRDSIREYPETKDILQIIHQFIRKKAVKMIPF